MSRLTALFISFALLLPGVTGCASKYGEQRTTVNYYPACYAPVRDLRDRENDVAKTTVGGGVVGALGGALIGLLATGKAEGALVGAAAGGATGVIAGNIYAKKQKMADDNIRLASYLQDLDGDISRLDIDGAAAMTSLQCYDRAFNALTASIKARQISRDAASRRFAEIMTGREEAASILGQIIDSSRNLSREYEQAFIQEENNIQQPQRTSLASAQAKKRTIDTGRRKARSLAQKQEKWQEVRNDANIQTARQQREITALMADLENARI